MKTIEVDLYKYMFPLNVEHNTLAVIGLIQPLGSIMPISEMQARVFLDQLTGGCTLPTRAEMKTDVVEKREAMMKRFVKSRRHTIQVDYMPFMKELAVLIGCDPNVKELVRSDPKLAAKVFFGPNVPYTYRLIGPHSWKGAKEAIMTAPERVLKATNDHYDQSLLDQYVNYNPFVLMGYAIALIFLAIVLFF